MNDRYLLVRRGQNLDESHNGTIRWLTDDVIRLQFSFSVRGIHCISKRILCLVQKRKFLIQSHASNLYDSSRRLAISEPLDRQTFQNWHKKLSIAYLDGI